MSEAPKGGFAGDPAAALSVAGPTAVAATRRRRHSSCPTRRHPQSSPCCGTAAEAQADGSCCGTAAKVRRGRRGQGLLRMTTPTPAVLDQVDGDRMAATVAMLAADRFAGRRVGTPGGAAARAWLGQRLADLGAEISFAPFPVRSVPDVYAAPTVRWRDGRTVHELGFGRDVAMHLASAETPLIRCWLSPVGETRPVGGCWYPTA